MAIGDPYTGDFSEPNPCVCAVWAMVQKPSGGQYVWPDPNPYRAEGIFEVQLSETGGVLYAGFAGIVPAVTSPLPAIGGDVIQKVLYYQGSIELFHWDLLQKLTLSENVWGRLDGPWMRFRQDRISAQAVVTFGITEDIGMPYGPLFERATYFSVDASGYLNFPLFPSENEPEGYAGYPFPVETPMLSVDYTLNIGQGAIEELTAQYVKPSLPGSSFRGDIAAPPSPTPPPPAPDIGGEYENVWSTWVISGVAEFMINACVAPIEQGGWYVNHGAPGTPDWKLHPVFGNHGGLGSPDWRRHPGYGRTDTPDWIRRS